LIGFADIKVFASPIVVLLRHSKQLHRYKHCL
jgi:hypothetical protein